MATAAPQSYHLTALSVTLDAQRDGSIQITESMGFHFDVGTFSYAYRDIPWSSFDELTNVSVTDESGNVLGLQVRFQWEGSGEYHLRWAYPAVTAPAERRFVLTYTVTGALLQPAAARNRVDWLAVGTGWNVPIDNASVRLLLPSGVDNVTALAFSPLPSTVLRVNNRTAVLFAVGILPANTGYRVIVDFPKVVDARPDLLRIARDSPISTGVCVFAAILFAMFVLWFVKGRDARPRTRGVNPPLQVPSDLRPAEVGYLRRQLFDVASMFAALIDLAQRGYLILYGAPVGWRARRTASPLDLTEKGRAAGLGEPGEYADLIEPEHVLLQALARTDVDRLTVLRTEFVGFGRRIEDRMLQRGLVTKSPTAIRNRYAQAAALVMFTGLVLAGAGIWFPDYFSLRGPLVGLAMAAVPIGIIGIYMPRWSDRGAEERSRWLGFMNALKVHVERAKKTNPGEAVATLDAFMAFVPLLPHTDVPRWLKQLALDLRGFPYEASWYASYPAIVLYPEPGRGHGGTARMPLVDLHALLAADFGAFAGSLAATFGVFSGGVGPSGGGAVGAGGAGGGGGGGGGAG